MSIQLERPPMAGGFTGIPVSPTADFGLDYEKLLWRCLINKDVQEDVSVVTFGNLDCVITTSVVEKHQEEENEKAAKPMENADSSEDTEFGDKEIKAVEVNARSVLICEKSAETMYKLKRKKKVKAKKKNQGEMKPWAPVDLTSLAFEFSLLPRRAAVLEGNTDEMDRELKIFEKECTETDVENAENSENDIAEKESENATEKTDNLRANMDNSNKIQISEMDRIGYEYVINFHPKMVWDCVQYDRLWDDYTSQEYFEDFLSAKEIRVSNIELINQKNEHLRPKKKWKVMKAHRQIKSRYCVSVVNRPHGTKLYMHHLVFKDMRLCPWQGKPIKQSMKRIDRDKGLPLKGEIKDNATKFKAPIVPPSQHNRQYPVAQPAPPAAISAYNFDGDLAPSLVNILIQLQTRDLTPEDYDLLLQLDERVQPKAVSAEKLESFKTDTVTLDTAGDVCAVCMEVYEIGQVRKFLPCGHVFHRHCIDNWLSNAPSCPLDNESWD